jgi:hypothetical protein
MAESSAVSFLILCHTAANYAVDLAEGFLQSLFIGLETQVANKERRRHACQMLIPHVSAVLLSLFARLRLLNVQVAAHVLASIVGDGFFHIGLSGEFDKCQTFGSSCFAVHQKVRGCNLANLSEELFDILFGSLVR